MTGTSPSRIRVAGLGLAVIATVAVPLVWLSWYSFGPPSSSFRPTEAALFWISAVGAPVFLLTQRHRAVAPETVGLCLFALTATLAHPVFASRWAAIVSVVGLALWFLCTLIVVGAPA